MGNKSRTTSRQQHSQTPINTISNKMGFLSSGSRFMGSKTKQHSAAVSKEANKSIAKDPNTPADARLRAGFRGIGDRWKQSGHKADASGHRHAAKHNYYTGYRQTRASARKNYI